tara:strand:- start:102 stop:689 length:588 start_codon:yes stop_codon:yes gene_type:complete
VDQRPPFEPQEGSITIPKFVQVSVDLPVLIRDTDNSIFTPEAREYCNTFADRQSHSSNVKADMTHWCIWEETNALNPVLDGLGKFINDHPWASCVPAWVIAHAWVARYKEGQNTIPHHHFPAHLSFIYFLKCSEGSSPLHIEGVDIEAKEGRLVVFPPIMLHSVSATPAERIVLAGNVEKAQLPVVPHPSEAKTF